MTSQGKVYDAYESAYGGLEYDGMMWDGAAFEPWTIAYKDEADKMTAIPNAEDMTVNCFCNNDPELSVIPFYTVYDASGLRLACEDRKVKVPEESGVYYVEIVMGWGTEYRHTTYGYYFKIIRD